MDKNDKLRHIENVEKDMTAICYKECFRQKTLKLDMKCVQICYDKYLYSINSVR